MAGYQATDTVHIVNAESEPMQFTFVETSCHAAGYTVSLTVEPMHGTVPAKSRFIEPITLIHHFNLLTSTGDLFVYDLQLITVVMLYYYQ